MADRRTLEQRLLAAKQPVPAQATCPACGRGNCAPFEIVDVSDITEIEGDEACGSCFIDVQRERTRASEQKALEVLPVGSWLSSEGVALKAHRNRTLDAYRWTIMPDSPLSPVCQREFKEFMLAWQRMTIDAPVISAFKEPKMPALRYATLTQARAALGIIR